MYSEAYHQKLCHVDRTHASPVCQSDGLKQVSVCMVICQTEDSCIPVEHSFTQSQSQSKHKSQ